MSSVVTPQVTGTLHKGHGEVFPELIRPETLAIGFNQLQRKASWMAIAPRRIC